MSSSDFRSHRRPLSASRVAALHLPQASNSRRRYHSITILYTPGPRIEDYSFPLPLNLWHYQIVNSNSVIFNGMRLHYLQNSEG
ncbi:hypothetical protein ACS0TY_008246 [Phlomoides rotata]